MPSQTLICWNRHDAWLDAGRVALAGAAMAGAGSAIAAAAIAPPAISLVVKVLNVMLLHSPVSSGYCAVPARARPASKGSTVRMSVPRTRRAQVVNRCEMKIVAD